MGPAVVRLPLQAPAIPLPLFSEGRFRPSQRTRAHRAGRAITGRPRGAGEGERPAPCTLSRDLRIHGRRLPADHVSARTRDAASVRNPDASAVPGAHHGTRPHRKRDRAVAGASRRRCDQPPSWIEGHRDADRGHEFDVFTSVDDGAGTAWLEKSTLLARRAASGKPASRSARQALRYEKPAEGQSPATADIAAPRAMGRRYGWLSGDLNPIHLSDRGARMFRFRTRGRARHVVNGASACSPGPGCACAPGPGARGVQVSSVPSRNGAARALAPRQSPGLRAEGHGQ